MNAEKLLARMRETKAGWSEDDYRKLYEGFGFNVRDGRKHIKVSHPDFPQLRATVGRHRKLSEGYAEDAIAIIDALNQLQCQEPPNE